MKQRLAITMGDPAGVGPEICLRLLASDLAEQFQCIVYGNAEILQRCADTIGLPMTKHIVEKLTTLSSGQSGVLHLPSPGLSAAGLKIGTIQKEHGEAAYLYLDTAIRHATEGHLDAIITGPIHKQAWHLAGHTHPGHTELFAERFHAEKTCMLQYSDALVCSFVTVHVGYHEVPSLLTKERIVDVIELTGQALKKICQKEPEMLVCGLNPHAGEGGLFGNGEEERIIVPAMEQARSRGWKVQGPLPPDTVFIPDRLANCDAVICMYHDQGHIPIKMLAFDKAVNTTLGLPFVRTSVDHGTAFDIAWQGKANPGSLYSAVRLAAKLHRGND